MTNDERMTNHRALQADSEEAFWNSDVAARVREEPETKRVYDLEERTARFGEAVIDFAKAISQNAVTNRIINMEERKK